MLHLGTTDMQLLVPIHLADKIYKTLFIYSSRKICFFIIYSNLQNTCNLKRSIKADHICTSTRGKDKEMILLYLLSCQ